MRKQLLLILKRFWYLTFLKSGKHFLDSQHPALVIYDRFKGQCTPSVLSAIDKNNVDLVIVPANCTNRLQPLDVSLNKSAKEFLRRKLQEWYTDQVHLQLRNSEEASPPVDLKISVVKPLGATWLIELYDYFKTNSEWIYRCWNYHE